MDLAGKRILVTGSSQGLGRIFVKEFAARKAHVIVNCAHHREKAEAVAEEIRAAGNSAEVYICDVSNEQAVNKMFEDLGRVDVLVNNARIEPWNRTPDMTEGEWWDKVIAVGLKSAFLCSWSFFEQAKKNQLTEGVIINISSVRAFRAAELNTIAYGTAKLGMHALTRAFAENGAPLGIRANTICPGMVCTENIDKRLTPEQKAKESAAIPLGRGSTMEENFDAVLFAVTNDYMTGETININGGMYYAP